MRKHSNIKQNARAEYKYVLDSVRNLKREKKTRTLKMFILLSRKYLFHDKYKLALKTIKKAHLKDTGNPETLWVYARCLEENDQDRKAIELYRYLLKKGELKLHEEYPCLGKNWIESLLNDCRLSLAMCYYVLLKEKLAIRWFELHLKYRRRGLNSYFTKKDISKFYDMKLKRIKEAEVK